MDLFHEHRSELCSIYQSFTRMVHTQFSTPIRVFRSDFGGEYLFDVFRQFLTSEGTLPQLSCPGAHAQNGVAERKHRHLIETTRTLLISSFVPSHFWGEAVSTAVYLINRQPSSKLSGQCPGEVLFGTPPSYDHLRVFGCKCYVLLAPRERTKLTAQSVECVFLGYSPEHKGYRCYDPSSRRIRVSRDVTFVEDCPFFYNPSTQPSYSPIESTFFLSLSPFSSTDDVTPSPPVPSSPVTFITDPTPSTTTISVEPPSPPPPPPSKPPVIHVYSRCPKTLPPNPIIPASPDAPVSDESNNIVESHDIICLESQVGSRYNLRDRSSIGPADMYGFPRVSVVIDEPSTYKEASSLPEWQLAMSEELADLLCFSFLVLNLIGLSQSSI